MNQTEILERTQAKIDQACKHGLIIGKSLVCGSSHGRPLSLRLYVEKQKLNGTAHEIVINLTKDFEEYHAAKTNAEREAERQALEEIRNLNDAAKYEKDLMPLLEEACSLCYSLDVKNSKFHIEHLSFKTYWDYPFKLALKYDKESFNQMSSLKDDIQQYKNKLAETKRLEDLKSNALSKLTPEELKVLGLSK